MDPSPGPRWLKPKRRERGGRQWFAVCFLHMVPRFSFKVLVRAEFCVVRAHSSKLFFLKKNGNVYNKINSLLSMCDTELLVQSRFIPREFSEHLLNLCLI